jgi:membrane protease YdiL (CAAX protease family)
MTDPSPPSPDPVYLPGTNWTYLDVTLAFIAGLILTFIAAVLAVALSGGEEPSADLQVGLLVPAQSLGTLLALWFLKSRRKLATWLQAYGLVLRWRDWWALLVGVGLQILAAVSLTGLADFLSFDAPEQTVASILTDLDALWPKLVALVAVVVLAPVTEEIVFRGMLLSRMLRSFPMHVAVIFSGFVFAAIHVVLDPAAWYASIGLFPVGVVLGYLAISTGDLSRAIWAHAGINGLGALALLFADDLAELEESVGALVSLLR